MGSVDFALSQDKQESKGADRQHQSDRFRFLPDVIIHIHHENQKNKTDSRMQELAQEEIGRGPMLR